jgi:hypothetical protein
MTPSPEEHFTRPGTDSVSIDADKENYWNYQNLPIPQLWPGSLSYAQQFSA